jgi:Protein of unknown function (DUF551)
MKNDPNENWIKCNDKFPDPYVFVLVFANNKGTGESKAFSIARWDGNKWKFINHSPPMPNYGAWLDIEYNMDSEHVTHWMRLPKTPEE